MNDLASQAKKLGITINLTTHPFSTVVGHGLAVRAQRGGVQVDGSELGRRLDLRAVATCRQASRCTTRARPRTPEATSTRR